MPPSRFPIPQGTLDMLILQIVSLEPAHGYGIAQRLEHISRSVVQVNQGSLYPAIHRLEQKKWLRAGVYESGDRTRGEVLFVDGCGQETASGGGEDSWARLTGAVQLIFDEGIR